jgi:Ca2+-binding EF-hand superfamily protein
MRKTFAESYRKSNFAKLNTEALFKAVDADGNGRISEEEWIYFWSEVKSSGHSEKEILDEVYFILSLVCEKFLAGST